VLELCLFSGYLLLGICDKEVSPELGNLKFGYPYDTDGLPVICFLFTLLSSDMVFAVNILVGSASYFSLF